MHGAYLVIQRLWQRMRGSKPVDDGRRRLGLGWLITMIAVLVAWVPFRATTVDGTFGIWQAMILQGPVAPASWRWILRPVAGTLEQLGVTFGGPGYVRLRLLGSAGPVVFLALLLALFLPHSDVVAESLFGLRSRANAGSLQGGWRAVALGVAFFASVIYLGYHATFLYFQFREDRMERKFLAFFSLTAVVLAVCMAGLNWYVDPFARHAAVDDGFDRGPAYTLSRRLFKLIAFKRWMNEHPGEVPSIVIGDSTANQIDDEAVSKLTWKQWYSMAFGGAGLNEMTGLMNYILANCPVKEFVWGGPFTRMMGDIESDMPRSIEMPNAPLKHMFTYEALQASLLVLRATWTGVGFDDRALDTGGEDVVT